MENKKKIVYKNVSELVPYENNPRHNDDAVDYVANSIKNFHFQVPIVIDKNNVVIAGHTRLKACEKLGIDEVPCIVADDLTPEQVKAFRLADNKTSELAWTSFDKGAKIYHYLWNGLVREGSRDLELYKRVHPTQKPVGMIINILTDFTEENNSIIDCFGGSGSTLIACEQSNRKCYMMELDPHYVDVIIERWENFTGQKAKLLKGV